MRADLTKVRQSLFNLLANAAKFTEDGEITLDVQRDGDFRLFVVRDYRHRHDPGADGRPV